MEIPCLTKKQLEVATLVVNQGFYYCGNANNFCEPDFTIPVIDGWEISYSPGGFIDLYCNDALFSKNLEATKLNVEFETELKSVKKIIRNTYKKWDSSRVNHVQLSLLK